MGLQSEHEDLNSQYRSIINIAEQLKLPLIQILNQAELNSINGLNSNNKNIEVSAEYAIKLIDNYLLSLKLESSELKFKQESVSISSILYDSAESLNRLAKQYSVKLELDLNSNLSPVIANRIGLESAITSLGTSLIETLPAQEDSDNTLTLSSHKCRYGIVAGIYLKNTFISSNLLKAGRSLMPITRQPIPNLSHTAGAGIFVADNIFRAMQLNLRTSRHNDLYGLGTVLKSNYQLHLI